jgi:hemerythrin
MPAQTASRTSKPALSANVSWDASMSTGLVQIDEQHKELIQKLNELTMAMKQQRARAEIEGIIDFLEHYVSVHFSDEEGCMEKYHCPMAEINQRAHVKFTQTFYELRAQFQKEGPSAALAIAIQRDLRDWLINHIRQVDISLHSCTREAANPRAISFASGNGRH